MAQGIEKIKKLLADPTLTEIMINGYQATWLEIGGGKTKIDVVFSEEDIQEIIDEYFTKVGKIISYYTPYGDV